MASVQDIKRRVRSVQNTRKITRAMELVAAAKLRRAQSRIEAMRPYAERMKKAAPMAIERTYNNRYFFSNRVNTKGLVYQGIYQDWSIPALALK